MPKQRNRRTMAITVAGLVALSFACVGGAGAATDSDAAPAASVSSLMTSQLDAAGLRRLANAPWRGYRARADAPTIRVSSAYGDPSAIAQRWSSFFESLIHGSELQVLNAYVAPLDEVRQLCGNSEVLGCYGNDHLVMPDEDADGIAATSIATHEYGHHVAFNRVNPPWTALNWGTKRWATEESVCPRVSSGTAFPGAEDANYTLNPGEAFAETYRVLNETSVGLPITWPLVDPSFHPDPAALEAVREDVLDPWTAPTIRAQRFAFSGRARTWTMQVATPLDGQLDAQIQPGSDDVTLLSADGRTVLSHGTWSTSGAKAFDYLICGQRSFVLRITRHTPPRRFALRLSIP